MVAKKKMKDKEEESLEFKIIGIVGNDKWKHFSEFNKVLNEYLDALENCEIALLCNNNCDLWILESIEERIPYHLYISKHRNISTFKSYLKRAKQLRICQLETPSQAKAQQINWLIEDCDEFIIFWNGNEETMTYKARQQMRRSGKPITGITKL